MERQLISLERWKVHCSLEGTYFTVRVDLKGERESVRVCVCVCVCVCVKRIKYISYKPTNVVCYWLLRAFLGKAVNVFREM